MDFRENYEKKMEEEKNNFQLLKKSDQEIKLKLMDYKVLIIIIY